MYKKIFNANPKYISVHLSKKWTISNIEVDTVEQSRSLASHQSLRADSLKSFLGAQEIYFPHDSFFLAPAMMTNY